MTLELDEKKMVAKGRYRSVFIHPDDPDRLVKVLMDTSAPGGPVKRYFRDLWPMTRYRFLFREYQTALRAHIVANSLGVTSPVAAQYGLVDTNLGLGMVCECVRLDGEVLGRTLRKVVVDDGLEAVVDPLNDFAARMYAVAVRANDLHGGNIVLGHQRGQRNFVLVDGMGDSHVIPIRTVSDRANALHLNGRFKTIARVIGLDWDGEARRFRLP